MIVGISATVGRGEENDIVLADLKSSRVHAQFIFAQSEWNVKDLGSANGIQINQKRATSGRIVSGDVVSLGETSFEFLTAESPTLFLLRPPQSAEEIQKSKKAESEHLKRVLSLGSATATPAGQSQSQKKVLIYVVLAIAGALFFLMDDPSSKAKVGSKKVREAETQDLSKYLPAVALDSVTARTVDQFYKAGFREFLNGNYLRAKPQFETVLQMQPSHQLARIYLENCDKELITQVDLHLKRGKRAMAGGKYKEAKANFESVLRFMFKDQASPAFTEARDQIELVNKMMKGEVK